MKKACWKGFLAFFLFLSCSARGEITQTLGVDVGFSPSSLVNGSVQVLVWEHWQFGLGYGLIPGLTAAQTTMTLDPIVIPGPAGLDFTVAPKLSLGLTTLTPFIRWFPHRNNFYVEFAYPLWLIQMTVNGVIAHPLLGTFPEKALQGNFTLTQPMPSLSVGYIFAGKFGFFNLSIGATIFGNPTVTGTLTGVLPDDVLASADESFDAMQEQMSEQLATVAAQMRQQLPYIPRLSLSFGFFL